MFSISVVLFTNISFTKNSYPYDALLEYIQFFTTYIMFHCSWVLTNANKRFICIANQRFCNLLSLSRCIYNYNNISLTEVIYPKFFIFRYCNTYENFVYSFIDSMLRTESTYSEKKFKNMFFFYYLEKLKILNSHSSKFIHG